MKKIILLISLLAIFTLIFVGCQASNLQLPDYLNQLLQPSQETPEVPDSTLCLPCGNGVINMSMPSRTMIPYDYEGVGVLTWSSSNDAIAQVNPYGLVTPVAPGTATIFLTDGRTVVGQEICVYQRPTDYCPRISEFHIDLTVGASQTLKGTYTGEGTTQWFSSNEDVATVVDGTVTAVAPGTTHIFLRAGSIGTYCTVTVTGT